MSRLGILILAVILFFMVRNLVQAAARRAHATRPPPRPDPPEPGGPGDHGDVIDVEVIEKDNV